MNTIVQTNNWAESFIEGSPLTAWGLQGFEPMLTIGNNVRNTILNAPLIWPWNRNEFLLTGATALQTGVQDYTFNVRDFAYLEKVSLLSVDGLTPFEVTDVYNTNVLGIGTSSTAQPNAACIKYFSPGINISMRFLPVPDQAYTGTLTYQKLPIPFQIFNFESVEVISGVAYYTFSATQNFPTNFLVGQDMQVQGFDIAANNGTFVVLASTNNYFILANPNAVTDVAAATGINVDWFPIPDHFSEIYTNLYLAEAMSNVDDARSQVYRQRGIAALLSKAEGLSDMQVNTFLAQAMARSVGQEISSQTLRQQGGQGRGI